MLLAKEKAEKEQRAIEYKAWMEERKTKLATEKLGAVRPIPTPQHVDVDIIAAKMEERRLRWIQECTPWRFVTTSTIYVKLFADSQMFFYVKVTYCNS